MQHVRNVTHLHQMQNMYLFGFLFNVKVKNKGNMLCHCAILYLILELICIYPEHCVWHQFITRREHTNECQHKIEFLYLRLFNVVQLFAIRTTDLIKLNELISHHHHTVGIHFICWHFVGSRILCGIRKCSN